MRLQWPDGRGQAARLVSIGKSGGAGEVFSIEGMPGHVAKIYHASIAPPQLARYEAKIRWMLENRPELPPLPPAHAGVVQLAWPVALVVRDGRFAGFAMEKIDFERTMELDYLLTRRQAAAEGFEADFGKLVTICCNLAALVDCLHGRNIAVVDLKPINLKVYKSELYVSILDCDGFYIESERFVSEAPQVTPEYLAPEFQDRAVTQPRQQDRFALATIIFRLLNFGIHPFAGIAVGQQFYPTELSGRIKLGLFPYGLTAHKGVRAAPASMHASFPEDIRALFDRSFAPGGAARASALEWATLLNRYADRAGGAMAACAQGHLRFAGKPCPTCVRAAVIQGHVARRRRFMTRLQTTPARALRYVQRSIRGTHPSPFQAALAQGQFSVVQLAPVNASIRQVVASELAWTIGLVITCWWLM